MGGDGSESTPSSDREARAAVARVLRELFDVPAVLMRQKPLSALAGWEYVAGLSLHFFDLRVSPRTHLPDRLKHTVPGERHIRGMHCGALRSFCDCLGWQGRW
jgi:hypothetical protein